MEEFSGSGGEGWGEERRVAPVSGYGEALQVPSLIGV